MPATDTIESDAQVTPTEAAQIEAAADAALDASMRIHMQADGKPEADEPPARKEPETPAEPKPAPEPKPETKPESGVDPDDLQNAIAHLQLDNVPQDLIESMAARPDSQAKLLAWGKKAAKRHADVDRLRSAGNKPEGEQPPVRPRESAPPDEPLDLDEVVKPLAEIDPSSAETIKNLGQRLHKHYQQREDALRAQFSGALGSLNARLEDFETRGIRNNLLERFPQVKDDTQFERLKATARRLAKSPDYQTLDEVYDHAAAIEFGPAQAAELRALRAQVNDARDRGQPTVGTQAPHTQTNPAIDPDRAADEFLDKALGFKR